MLSYLDLAAFGDQRNGGVLLGSACRTDLRGDENNVT